MQAGTALDLSQVEVILQRYPRDEASLVMVLQDVQATYNHLPADALERVARHLQLPPARVYSVATFYKIFTLEPQGKTVLQVCKGTACHVQGAQLIEDELCRQTGTEVGQTSADGAFTVRTVNCVGACAMAPVVIAGETAHANVQPGQVRRLLRQAARQAEQRASAAPAREAPVATTPAFADPEDLLQQGARWVARRQELPLRITVCGGPGCLAAGARQVQAALAQAASDQDVPLALALERCTHDQQGLLGLSGCQGLCQEGPLVQVHQPDGETLYSHVSPEDAGAIIEATRTRAVVQRRLSHGGNRAEHPFYRLQQLRALATCGQVNPESLEDYLGLGGFRGLATAVAQLSPEQVLQAVEQSGLRGRGGAGFQTARKWRTALRAARDVGLPPFVLCNGDEGDPGAFMDRAIMEGSPYQVLEGMILGAYALGAAQGYVYVRAEYPLAVERLEQAIQTCRQAGLLGQAILGQRGFDFDLRISRGGGAFVCGESTALMRSIEGKVGEPRAKYVRSAERGLYDSPTVLNNVETWAVIPGIVADGPDSFAGLGTERSKGTKAFSLTGQVQRSGLVEVPMGTTLRQLIVDIGGGVPEGRRFKAVQTGGPSGGCLPEDRLDLPVDFDALTEAGSMMGSGGMIVMDDHTCMVDVARYFVDFLLEESCGKCTACRLGLPQLSQLLSRITRGEGEPADLEAIEHVSRTMTDCALCGLGKSAANPVLSTLRYFRDEYQAHLQGHCPAGVCRDLISYTIGESCTGCLACIKPCPTGAISGAREQRHLIDDALCTRCGICRSICQYDAVHVSSGVNR